MVDYLSAEMEAAYASGDVDVDHLHTIEISHPEFDDPVRLVANSDDDITATLEDDAPYDAGESVTFSAVSFSLVEPGFDEEGQPTPARVSIDNVSGQIAAIMKHTRAGSHPIGVTYRVYRSDGLTAPGQVIRGLELTEVEITARTASGSLTFPEKATQNFPRQVYDIDRFPGLYAQ